MRSWLVWLTASAALLNAQSDIVGPRLIRKVAPQYTVEAKKARIQGTAALDIVIDENGRPRNIVVISPLGFGLDEEAIGAVRQWEFTPATKDGKPVAAAAVIEVNFQLMRSPAAPLAFDERTEKRRTRFNVALQHSRSAHEQPRTRAIEDMQRLAQEKFPPAMCLLSQWMEAGQFVPKDLEGARRMEEAAAELNSERCMYELGRRRVEGGADVERGLAMLRDAATLGSRHAQFYLGNRYAAGDGVEKDVERAERYVRLCAAAGEAACQLRIGQTLLANPARSERDAVEAVAWLEIASESGVIPARELLEKQRPDLTPEQTARVKSMKPRLVPKP